MENTKPETDINVYVDGTICLLFGSTPAGKTWLDENLEDGPMMGQGYAVESRFVPPIIDGAMQAGLDVRRMR